MPLFHPDFPPSGELPGAKVKIGSTTAISNLKTIIDSGTTIAYGPPADVKEIFAQVESSALFFYSYPCDSPPEISFNWGALAARDFGLGTHVFLLGDTYMKNQYNVFDFDQEAVGFAQLSLAEPEV
ncbi:aspartic peptidase domain-containing protein [Mycena olivaceomarginata]|nr:aspartic peptidase domain-containing protein [Mycena olivaceomarginata]